MDSNLFWLALGIGCEADSVKRSSKVNFQNGEDYRKKLGYNEKRQHELRHLACVDLRAFCKVLGHNLDYSKYSEYRMNSALFFRVVDESIKEISHIEGWRYYDEKELWADPVYRKLVNMEDDLIRGCRDDKTLMSKHELNEFLEETNRNGSTTLLAMIFSIIVFVTAIALMIILSNWAQQSGSIMSSIIQVFGSLGIMIGSVSIVAVALCHIR